MLKPKSKVRHGKPLEKGYPKTHRKFRPLAYYIAGGSDLDGDALRPTSEPPMPDAEEDSDTMMVNFGTDDAGELLVPNDPFCDPRHDVFSLFGLAQSPTFKDAVKSGSLARSKAPVETTGDADTTTTTNN